jgi:hypothetical protein
VKAGTKLVQTARVAEAGPVAVQVEMELVGDMESIQEALI